MEVRHPDLVVLVVVGEEQLILRLRHVVDAARVGREEDLLLDVTAVVALDLDAEVTLRDPHARCSVAVHPHRPEMHNVDVELGLDDRDGGCASRSGCSRPCSACARRSSSSTAPPAARRSGRPRRAGTRGSPRGAPGSPRQRRAAGSRARGRSARAKPRCASRAGQWGSATTLPARCPRFAARSCRQ